MVLAAASKSAIQATKDCMKQRRDWRLCVDFLDQEVPQGWNYEGKPISTSTILNWANEWRGGTFMPHDPYAHPSKADIRVKFVGKLFHSIYISQLWPASLLFVY